MRKIASPAELHSELTYLLRYSQTSQPSRTELASALRDLSLRVASSPSATPNLDKVLDKDLTQKIKLLSDRINRAADNAEAGATLDRLNNIGIKATYELIHLFDPFLRGWAQGEADALEGLTKVAPTAKLVYGTIKKLDGYYRQAQEGGPALEVLTGMGIESATLLTAYRQLRHDVGR